MKSVFNEFRHVKHTKKKHQCSLCTRYIPEGHKAHNYVGEFEGDFQNWYLCDFCYKNVLDTVEWGDYLDSEYFWGWIRNNVLSCPECGKSDDCRDDYRLSKDDRTILKCECSHCGHKYTIKIPFDVDEANSDAMGKAVSE